MGDPERVLRVWLAPYQEGARGQISTCRLDRRGFANLTAAGVEGWLAEAGPKRYASLFRGFVHVADHGACRIRDAGGGSAAFVTWFVHEQ